MHWLFWIETKCRTAKKEKIEEIANSIKSSEQQHVIKKKGKIYTIETKNLFKKSDNISKEEDASHISSKFYLILIKGLKIWPRGNHWSVQRDHWSVSGDHWSI